MLWLTLRRLKSKQAPGPTPGGGGIVPVTRPQAYTALAAALTDPDDEESDASSSPRVRQNGGRPPHQALITALRDRDPEVLKAALTGLRIPPTNASSPRWFAPAAHGRACAVTPPPPALRARGWRPEDGDES